MKLPVVVQVTATLVTAAEMVPVALATVQVWPEGCAETATVYAVPEAMGVKAKAVPEAATVCSLAPFSVSLRPVPVRPETVPLTANVVAEQVTVTLVTWPLPYPWH